MPLYNNVLGIKVNGVEMPMPSSFQVDAEDLYLDAWRDNKGYQHGTRVRSNVRKLFFEWDYLVPSEVSKLQNMFLPQYVTIEYPFDPITGTWHTITAYKGASSNKLYSLASGYQYYEKVSFNCIEQ